MNAGDFELRFECTRCGSCCTRRGAYAHVYLSPDDAAALARELGLKPSAFKKRYTFVDPDGWRQLRPRNDRCVFLDAATGRCRVYAVRPTQCRTFPFWRENVEDGAWSEEVRSHCEGVGRGRLYSIEEVEARMLEIEASEAASG